MGEGSVFAEVFCIDVKPARVVMQMEINGYTRRHGDAVVLTRRHCLVLVVANAEQREVTKEFRPPWHTYYNTIACSLQVHSNNP